MVQHPPPPPRLKCDARLSLPLLPMHASYAPQLTFNQSISLLSQHMDS